MKKLIVILLSLLALFIFLCPLYWAFTVRPVYFGFLLVSWVPAWMILYVTAQLIEED